ncbi:probable peptidylglycine alpha-hydroxylating monooxygenase 1 [Argonauta hians]
MANVPTGISLLILLCISATAISRTVRQVEMLMPNVQPKTPDTYLCYSIKANSTPSYIVGFQPRAHMEVSHHILLYGCGLPGKDTKVWNCGEMNSKSSHKYEYGPTCRSSPSILYAWAMDAPKLKLPKDVGFKIGGDSNVQYLVVQVHYKKVDKFIPPKNGTDSSGVVLSVTDQPMRRRAGVYLLGTAGVLPRRSTIYMETACLYNEKINLHPFSYRTHTHTHGKVVSGYLIHNGQWKEIGRKNPQLPQMFYNTTHSDLVIKRGDILAARCTMKNDEDRDIMIGSTANDEMCNFYIMYYVDGNRIPEDNYCWSEGPLRWSWRDFFFQRRFKLANAPDTISVEPVSKKAYPQSILQNEAGRNEAELVESPVAPPAPAEEEDEEEEEREVNEREELQNDQKMEEINKFLNLLRENEEEKKAEEEKERFQRYLGSDYRLNY